jgi:uncharacterized protein YndB with AHSA1/START domain
LAKGVVSLQLFAIPIVGLAFFVLNPVVPPPLPPELLWVLIAPVLVALVLAGIWLRWHARQIRAAVTTPATIALQTRVAVANVACYTIALSTYLFLFEPVFAVANVIAYLVWVVVWMPRALRRYRAEVSIKVAAPPSRVWEYIVDVSNRPRYSVDLLEMTASPPGRLEVGSRITSRLRVPGSGSPAKGSELEMELKSVVTDIVPPIFYTVVALDRVATTTTKVAPTLGGCQITLQTEFVVSIADGIAGYAFRWPAAKAQFKANSTRSLVRLSELLSTPPPSAS